MKTGPRPLWRRVAVLVVAVIAALAISAGAPASAHADLVSADPAEGAVLDSAPDRIRFSFTESVTGVPEGVQVFAADGSAVASSAAVSGATLDVTLEDQVGQGTLVIVWRVISQDGHPVSGSLSFSIGSASDDVARPPVADSVAEVPQALTAVRWLGYVGLLLSAGLVCFAVLLLPTGEALDRSRRRLVGAVRLIVPLTAAMWLIGLPLTAAYQLGRGAGAVLDSAAWSTLTPTEYAVALAVVLGLSTAVGLLGDGGATRSRGIGAVVAGALAATAPALTGHPRAASPEALVVGADALHLLAGSVWLGGLLALVLVLPGLAGRDALGGETLARFSGVAAAVVAALAVTGSVMAWRIVGSWGALIATEYGRLLLIKIALALVVVAVAAWNRYSLLPRLHGTPRRHDREVGTRLVVRTTSVEAVVLVAVLLFTGLLVDRNPETVAGATSQKVQTGMLGAYEVTATMETLETGPNTVTVETRDFAGEAFEGLEAPQVRLSSDDVDLGDVTVTSVAPGAYAGPVVLPSSGTWRVQVSLRVSEFDNPVKTFDFVVAGE